MIKLQIEPYCENCPHFSAVTDMHVSRNYKNEVGATHCYVTCENRERCRKIYVFLENKFIDAEEESDD